MVKDMTKGAPLKLIISFAVPMILGNIFQQLYSVVDSLVLGRGVGVNALAAVGATGMVTWFILGFTRGMTHGYSIWISQMFGAGDEDGTKKAISHGAWLTLFGSVIIMVLSLAFASNLLKALNTPEDIYADALLYLQIILIGSVADAAYMYGSRALSALGDSMSPFIFVIISTIINIVLDLLFVVVFGWGVAGAAIATVISQVISALLCLIAMRRIKYFHISRSQWKIDSYVMGRMIRLGLPVGIMNSVTAIGGMLLQGIVNTMGSITVAAQTIGCRIVSIIETPTNILGSALGTFVGQNAGAKKFDRVREGTHKTLFVGFGISAVIAATMLLFGKQISSVFFADTQAAVIDLAYQYIAVCGTMIFALGVLFTYRYALQGMGETRMPLISGVLELALRLAVAFFLPESLGFWRICFAEVSAWVGAGLLLMITFYFRLAQEKRQLPQAEE